jgi:hypothetical protein
MSPVIVIFSYLKTPSQGKSLTFLNQISKEAPSTGINGAKVPIARSNVYQKNCSGFGSYGLSLAARNFETTSYSAAPRIWRPQHQRAPFPFSPAKVPGIQNTASAPGLK